MKPFLKGLRGQEPSPCISDLTVSGVSVSQTLSQNRLFRRHQPFYDIEPFLIDLGMLRQPKVIVDDVQNDQASIVLGYRDTTCAGLQEMSFSSSEI